MSLSIHYHTSKSSHHVKNEDGCHIGDNYVIVADGMGGESAGDVASRITIDTISKVLDSKLRDTDDVRHLLSSAIHQADDKISEYIDEHLESDGMGSTVLIMVCRGDRVTLAWCGDSRCYGYRAGRLCSLTKDHSYVQELVDAKAITEEEAFTHPDNNIITRYVGGGAAYSEPDYAEFGIGDHDILILCSDGISGYCRNNEIARTVEACGDPSALPGALASLALSNGSDDDITVATVTCG